MKLHWTSSKARWKDSLTISLAILTSAQAIAEVTGLFDLEAVESLSWWIKLIWIFVIFIILMVVSFIGKLLISRRGIRLNIGDNQVLIKQADIFSQDGLKLIPFNEYFDTTVDDIIIAHNSLNGIFIDLYIDDINELRQTIQNTETVKGAKPHLVKGRYKYPLGRIIKYNDYLLLAFTHFDENNNAYLSHTDYEKCLIKMWQEIRRTHANKPVYIPLIGSGITQFTDTPHKDKDSLIKCLLCTLKISGVHFKQPITICLTEDTMDELNIYELKSK